MGGGKWVGHGRKVRGERREIGDVGRGGEYQIESD